jgi:phosphatidylglycerol:prolipoprotein diacylglycerol transferase
MIRTPCERASLGVELRASIGYNHRMCSELLRIPIITAGGVPIFGVGVALLVWLTFSAWGLVSMAKVVGWPAALKAHLPTILVVAAAIALFIPRYFPDGVPVRGYGVMVLTGSVAGIALAVYRGQKVGIFAEEIMGLAIALFIGGVIGARLFYVIEYWDNGIRKADWLSTLKAALSFTEGGLVIYGAFIGAMIGFAFYVSRRKLPALALADLIVPSMLLGLAFGRIGCLLNGCCYGGETTVPWAVTFPRESGHGSFSPPYGEQAAIGRFYGFAIGSSDGKESLPVVKRVDAGSIAEKAGLKVGDLIAAVNGHSLGNVEGAEMLLLSALNEHEPLELRTSGGETKTVPAIEPPPRSRPVHPAQVYSSITAGLLAFVTWAYYPFRRRDGEVIVLMITLYPIARFLEESIRVDEPAVWHTGMSISQNISVLLLAVAVAMWIWLRKRPAGLALGHSAAAG